MPLNVNVVPSFIRKERSRKQATREGDATSPPPTPRNPSGRMIKQTGCRGIEVSPSQRTQRTPAKRMTRQPGCKNIVLAEPESPRSTSTLGNNNTSVSFNMNIPKTNNTDVGFDSVHSILSWDTVPPRNRRRGRTFPARNHRRGGVIQNVIADSRADEILDLEAWTKGKDWVRSFRDLDPRIQILEFFNDLSLEGVKNFESQGCRAKSAKNVPKLLRIFIKNGIFSVWRPTSPDAIAKMITGEGTGKGLEIKGKSAKCGQWSGCVPYLQIHDNEHKNQIGRMAENNRVRIFYPNESSRDTAAEILADRSIDMANRARIAIQIIEQSAEMEDDDDDSFSDSDEEDEYEDRVFYRVARRSTFIRKESMCEAKKLEALEEVGRYFMDDPSVKEIDDYDSAEIFGLEIPEKLFWESYIVPYDISRPKGSNLCTGRASMPEFQQMNIDTLRNWSEQTHSGANNAKSDSAQEAEANPRPVLWHGGCGRRGEQAPEGCDPMCPLGLLMAYEENDKVTPVVSDFDCFLLGTRGVKYEKPFGEQELSMLASCVEEIEGILATPKEGSSWTMRWLEVKKKQANAARDENDTHQMPKFGYADPLSYNMMTGAVRHLKSNGAVRHGPESFNYGFPQELDDQYLVISDTFPGVPWRYVNGEELIEILSDKIDEGFTFPLNPKWILCDRGWKKLYDKLMASTEPIVQGSMDIWYPDAIRRRINEISNEYPQLFSCSAGGSVCYFDQDREIRYALAEMELDNYMVELSPKPRRKSLGSVIRLLSGTGLELPRSTAIENSILEFKARQTMMF